jgi:hypothetical protein
VLCGHDDGPNRSRHTVLVLDGDLGLAVGPEVGKRGVLANRGQLLRESMGERDRERHELRRPAARAPEHHSLGARARSVVSPLPRV